MANQNKRQRRAKMKRKAGNIKRRMNFIRRDDEMVKMKYDSEGNLVKITTYPDGNQLVELVEESKNGEGNIQNP